MGRRLFASIALAAALAAPLLAAPAAQATFHLIQVREVYLGSASAPESKYVELQMYSGGQNHVGGHTLRLYGPSGAVVGTSTLAADVAGSANQSTILLATQQAEEQFGVAADAELSLSSPAQFGPAGGAACWEELDCVSWGSFAGSLPSAAGAAAASGGVPDGMALQRLIARGCATTLDPADDSDSSAADFAVAAPAPRPNSVAPSERSCVSGGGGGGGAGADDPDRGHRTPQTILRHKPPKRTRDSTPSFRFSADEPKVRFQCKLDGKRFNGCRSPFTAKPLTLGPHVFKVRAVNSDGTVDSSPAVYRFRVVAPRR